MTGVLWMFSLSFSCGCTSQGSLKQGNIEWPSQPQLSNCCDDSQGWGAEHPHFLCQPSLVHCPQLQFPDKCDVVSAQVPSSQLLWSRWDAARAPEAEEIKTLLRFCILHLLPPHPALPSYFPSLLLPLPLHYLQGKKKIITNRKANSKFVQSQRVSWSAFCPVIFSCVWLWQDWWHLRFPKASIRSTLAAITSI